MLYRILYYFVCSLVHKKLQCNRPSQFVVARAMPKAELMNTNYHHHQSTYRQNRYVRPHSAASFGILRELA